ncbi:hypothetical protein Bbelb_371960 [Branchiostoma belcheri]|nr:hypothetical protein Bbelb_371960 [Branchiostoma belcheri]
MVKLARRGKIREGYEWGEGKIPREGSVVVRVNEGCSWFRPRGQTEGCPLPIKTLGDGAAMTARDDGGGNGASDAERWVQAESALDLPEIAGRQHEGRGDAIFLFENMH